MNPWARRRRGPERELGATRSRGGGFDVTIIGGGIAGSTLAITLRRAGQTVTLVEQSERFVDRVRGEGLAPWGTALAASLGIESLLRERANARELPFWDTWEGGKIRRDVLADRDPHGRGVLTFRHHRAQQALIEHAEELGVNVIRPAKAAPLERNAGVWRIVAGGCELRSPLIVVANGRTGASNGIAATEQHCDPQTHLVNGALLDDLDVDPLAVTTARTPTGRVLLFPLSRDLVRVYHMTTVVSPRMRTPETVRTGIFNDLEALSPGVARRATFLGRCASFPNSNRWPSSVVGDGFVRIGDAAGSTDPSIGQGLAIALRDVSELASGLTGEKDITSKVNHYADQRARYFAVQRMVGLVSRCLDDPTADGAQYRTRLSLSKDPRRRQLLKEIRWDPASVDASPDVAAALLGAGDRDSSLEALPPIFGSIPYTGSPTTVPS